MNRNCGEILKDFCLGIAGTFYEMLQGFHVFFFFFWKFLWEFLWDCLEIFFRHVLRSHGTLVNFYRDCMGFHLDFMGFYEMLWDFTGHSDNICADMMI